MDDKPFLVLRVISELRFEMDKLFIEIYLDEDVNVLVANLIRSRGFTVKTTQESGNLGKTDVEQFEFAKSQKFVLLTHNRVDFERIAQEHFESNKTHCGLIIGARHPPREIVQRLLKILNTFTADEMKNQIIYI
jgi:predicted nuclease of predicted toxin-antitoxin system